MSDKIDNIEENEMGVVVEWDESNCRRDKLDSLADLVSNKKLPGGLWMLAEHFMTQIAYQLGYFIKFGF